MADLWAQLNDQVLTTAEILYFFPDYPHLLQQYVWQDYDLAPRFPQLNKFVGFWQGHLDGRLHSIRVTRAGLLTPGEIRLPAFEALR